MNTVLFVNATIGFSENFFLVYYFCLRLAEEQNCLIIEEGQLLKIWHRMLSCYMKLVDLRK